MRSFDRRFVAFNETLIFFLMSAMVALVFTNVIARYVAGASIIWAEEVAQYLMVTLAFVAAGLAMRRGRLVAVELLQNRLSTKGRLVLRVVVAITIFIFMAFLAYEGLLFSNFARSQETPVLNISQAIPYLAIPLGAGLFLIHFVLGVAAFIRGEALPEPEDSVVVSSPSEALS